MRIVQNSKGLVVFSHEEKDVPLICVLKIPCFSAMLSQETGSRQQENKLLSQQNIKASKQDKNTNQAVTLEDIHQRSNFRNSFKTASE